MKFPITSIFAALALLPIAVRADWRMEILADPWHFAGFENSLDISGVAAATPTHCLVGSDESFYIQPGVIERHKHRIESRRPVPLPIGAQDGKLEIDIEGVAFSSKQQAYYVVGSHGVGKKKADFQPDRHAVYQVPVDPRTGEVTENRIRRTSLLPWLRRTPLLADHVMEPLQQNGLNIEGLACSDGILHFGLRSPNKDGSGFVIELAAADLFQSGPDRLKVHEIPLQAGRGIREITAIRGGFLIVTGNASAEASKKIPVSLAPGPDSRFDLMFWKGDGAKPEPIGQLPFNGGKAEGLLVLDDSTDHVDVLVIFDSLPGGLPITVRLFR